MEILDPFECIDGTIGDHVIQIEDYTVHCYYLIRSGSENSVVGSGRGPVQCRDDHIHLFIYKRRLFLLRTDGGSKAEELIGNVPAHVQGTVLKRLRLIY